MKRNILFVASGMSPQVLTETLYALLHQTEPFIPDEVHLVTTLDGKAKAEQGLLGENKAGHFFRFCEDYGFNPSAFSHDNIHVICNSQGALLRDIKTPSDNEATADTITQLVRSFTESENGVLHVSLAGGRKTMSYYTGYALSLLGRDQDRLSHVLVDAAYEGCPDFYYPPPVSRLINNRQGEEFDASQATVVLADIPFVRLRSNLSEPFIEEAGSFSYIVRMLAIVNEPRSLHVDWRSSVLRVSGVAVPVNELQLAFLLMFAEDRLENREEAGFEVPDKSKPSAAIGRPYLRALCKIMNVPYIEDWEKMESNLSENLRTSTLNSLDQGKMNSTFYSQRRNELKTLFSKKLPKQLAADYLPSFLDKPGGLHGLKLDVECISISE